MINSGVMKFKTPNLSVCLLVALSCILLGLSGCTLTRDHLWEPDKRVDFQIREAESGGTEFISDEEMRVLAACLKSEFRKKGRPVVQFGIRDHSGFVTALESYYNIGEKLEEHFVALKPETLRDFHEQISREAMISPGLTKLVDCYLISEEKLDEMFAPPGWWSDFYREFPGAGGIITFSRVGFHPDGKQALVFVIVRKGGLSGRGYWALLEREADADWSVADELTFILM